MNKKTVLSLESLLVELAKEDQGKPTEIANLRLNRHDWHLVRAAFGAAEKYRSRHALMHDAVMSMAEQILAQRYGDHPSLKRSD